MFDYLGSRERIYGDGYKIGKKETKTTLQLRTTWSNQLILITLLKTYVSVFACLLHVINSLNLRFLTFKFFFISESRIAFFRFYILSYMLDLLQ